MIAEIQGSIVSASPVTRAASVDPASSSSRSSAVLLDGANRAPLATQTSRAGRLNGKTKRCLTCRTEFYVRPSVVSQRYCSLGCVPRESRTNNAIKRGEEHACEECGAIFYAKRSEIMRGGGRYCSRACFYAAGASDATKDKIRLAMRKRRGKANPNYKHGGRAGVRDRDGEARFKSGQTTCQHPTCSGAESVLHEHHVVYEQHVRRADGDRWDARNALRLCVACHSSHHRRGRVIPIAALRDENIAFAFELLGPAAYDYLRRYYEGEDPRVSWLLEKLYPQTEVAA